MLVVWRPCSEHGSSLCAQSTVSRGSPRPCAWLAGGGDRVGVRTQTPTDYFLSFLHNTRGATAENTKVSVCMEEGCNAVCGGREVKTEDRISEGPSQFRADAHICGRTEQHPLA